MVLWILACRSERVIGGPRASRKSSLMLESGLPVGDDAARPRTSARLGSSPCGHLGKLLQQMAAAWRSVGKRVSEREREQGEKVGCGVLWCRVHIRSSEA